ncbi:hypothetical protein GCG54_00009301 [Colletotrichum gloeosporioides]|uniref:NACHT domain-containing protein n=1 Tax=Colletotrichum gloeosporioides TaxID=474922 RepID=A0A8H4FCT9_COLGL|nr:uncharacterized protein GCG54_00009301 [Colletotrichum gloeosporioides]KAF3797330.1 hypothetical protein GCG54_00009301 [Colletotrichum gloeosporioides]
MDQPPITIGNVNIGPGATGIVGVNYFGSDNDNPEIKLKGCIEAFYVTDPKVDRDELINIKGEVTDGTCHWIRDDEMYNAWLNNEYSQLLWISGSPGQGKTMLSIFLTDELESLADDSTHVLFHFCSHRNEEKSTATAILRTLLHQIFKRTPTLAKHALSRMATANRVRDTLNSRGILWQILTDVLNDPSLGPVVCLLDGLDECKDGSVNRLITDLRKLFGFSGRAARQTLNTFKIVVLSRKIVGLHGFLRLDLESKTKYITSDVHHFVDAKIREHPVYPTIDEGFWNNVTSMIRERCSGTFLWAGLVLNEILSKDNQTEMRQVLEEVPGGLDAIYARILSNVPSRWRQDVARLLHWVASAVRPLSVSQVAEAWYPDCAENQAVFQKVRDLVSMSGSLIKTDTWCWAERLSLIHSSVGDYLIRPVDEEEDNHAPHGFQLESQAVHREMAEICLRSSSALVPMESRRQIREPGIHVTLYDDMILEERNFNRKWISYAVFSWPSHAKACAEAADGLVNFDLPFFHDRSPIRDEWFYVFTHPLGEKKDVVEVEEEDVSLLQILPALGLTSMMSKVLRRMRHQDKDYINRMQGRYTALCHAAFYGHEDTVDLLLAEGARVTEGHPSQACALQAAFQQQHYRIAKTLLEHVCRDANEYPVPRQERIPTSLTEQLLFHALGGYDVRLVKLLYDNGIATSLDPEAIRYALHTGSGPVFEFLLDQGFDPNALNEKTGLTPLSLIALGRSDSEVVGVAEVLLRRGANVDERDRDGVTALHWAAHEDHGALIPTLLAHGADVNATDANSARPIDTALVFGSLKVAEMLLDASMGTEVELFLDQNTFRALNYRMTAVHDKPEMVRLFRMLNNDIELPQRICEKLLQRGVDINLGGRDGSTTLDLFDTPLRLHQSDYVLCLMQHGARCESDEDTDKLIEALSRWASSLEVSSDDWDTESE